MKRIILALFVVGLSFLATNSNAQTGVSRDDQGEYRYETREERVWVPEQRTGGIFGVGGRTIPGHYETQSRQVKVYRDQHGNYDRNGQYSEKRKGWEGRHPHGMPPGQRKKLEKNNGYYDRNSGGVIRDRDREYDGNNDGVIDRRDRVYDRNNDDRIDDRDQEYNDRDYKKNKKSKSGKKGKSRN